METYLIPNGQNHIQFHVANAFDGGVAALQKQMIPPISAEHLALSRRLVMKKMHPVSSEGSWVAENFVYDNGKDADVLVTAPPHAPILLNVEEVTAAHRKRKEFSAFNYATLRELADADPIKAIQNGVLLLPRASIKGRIPTTAFSDEPLTLFLFRDEASQYGQFLQPDLTDVPVYLVHASYAKSQNAPFARSLWIGSLDKRSDLYGRGLHSLYAHFSGVRFVEGLREFEAALEERV